MENEDYLRRIIRDELRTTFKYQLNSSIVLNDLPEKKPEVKHQGLSCDICKVTPIVGIRYHCSVCSDYDLCANCEEKVGHNHPLLKLRSLQKSPIRVHRIEKKEQYRASFVSTNLKDKQEVKPGEVIEANWVLINSGTIPWPVNTKFVLKNESNPSLSLVAINPRDIGEREPNSLVELRVKMKMPESPGRYTGFFTLKYNGVEEFGPNLRLDVIVIDENKRMKVEEKKRNERIEKKMKSLKVPPGMTKNMRHLLEICETISPEYLLEALKAKNNNPNAVMHLVYSGINH